jgi:hypothetical protein
MLFMLRWFLRPAERNSVAGGAMSLDQLRRRSEDEHRKAWQLNLVWLIAGVAVIVLMPNLNGRRDGIVSGLFLIDRYPFPWVSQNQKLLDWDATGTCLSFHLARPLSQPTGAKTRWTAALGGGGSFDWKSAGAIFVFFLIGLDLFPLFLRWLAGLPLAGLISTNLALAVLGVIILSMFWAVVRTRSLRAARAIQDELDALDNIERKQ